MSQDQQIIIGYIIVITTILIFYNVYHHNYSVIVFYLIFFSPYLFQGLNKLYKNMYKKYQFYRLHSSICQNLKFKELKDVENQISNECSICLDTVELDEQITIIPCGCIQLYHPPCILSWLKINPSCPSCRKEFI